MSSLVLSHGTEHGEIILEGEDNKPQFIQPDIIRGIFEVVKDEVRLIIFNACYSSIQAEAVIEEIDCAIGITGEIPDDAAIQFASVFYQSVACGRSVLSAYKFGVVALRGFKVPKEQLPIIKVRSSIDANKLFLIRENQGSEQDNTHHDKVTLELRIEGDTSTFTYKDRNNLSLAISILMNVEEGEVLIKRVRRGSIIVDIEIPLGKLNDLLLAVEKGDLQNQGVRSVRFTDHQTTLDLEIVAPTQFGYDTVLEENSHPKPIDELNKSELSHTDTPLPNLALPSQAELNPYYRKSWAVVIGINNYNDRFPRLTRANNDAQAMAKVLGQRGFETIVLYDDQATRRAILQLLRYDLPKFTHMNDRVIFFFAGHGITRTEASGSHRNYLVPQDGTTDTDYIDMEELRQACDSMPAKHILILLDCCFSGALSVTARSTISNYTPPMDDIYLKRITQKYSRQILVASDSGGQAAVSSIQPDYTAFTSALLAGLNGEADLDNDGIITVSDLAAYTRQRVVIDSANSSFGSQTPSYNYLMNSDSGDFVFVAPSKEMF